MNIHIYYKNPPCSARWRHQTFATLSLIPSTSSKYCAHRRKANIILSFMYKCVYIHTYTSSPVGPYRVCQFVTVTFGEHMNGTVKILIYTKSILCLAAFDFYRILSVVSNLISGKIGQYHIEIYQCHALFFLFFR